MFYVNISFCVLVGGNVNEIVMKMAWGHLCVCVNRNCLYFLSSVARRLNKHYLQFQRRSVRLSIYLSVSWTTVVFLCLFVYFYDWLIGMNNNSKNSIRFSPHQNWEKDYNNVSPLKRRMWCDVWHWIQVKNILFFEKKISILLKIMFISGQNKKVSKWKFKLLTVFFL